MGRPSSRHGLTAAKAHIRLRGFVALDRRTVGARAMLAFRDELVAALGGDADLSPQRKKLVDLAVRAAAYLDHIDAFLAAQESVITRRTRQPAVVPVLLQRQAIADHLLKVLAQLGLERRPRPVPSLQEYVTGKYAGHAERPGQR